MPSATPDMDLNVPLSIGDVVIRNRAFLAPMSGVTDAVFRKLAWQFGAGLVVSEMIASKALIEGKPDMHLKLIGADLPVHMVQIAGREAHWMALGAKMAVDNGAHIVDINMGCPSKRVTTGYSGSALMQDLDHALELIDAVVGAVDVPVTLKMRLGWDYQSINAPELARRAESSGVKMITVHGRTRCQFYKGEANWNAISSVRDETSLPLVVNGDIVGTETAGLALSASGADAVMVGRGSYGAPWLPGQIAKGEGSVPMALDTIIDVAKNHYDGMLSLYGRDGAVRPARKHLAWYLADLPEGESLDGLRRKILTSWNPDEVLHLLDKILGETEGSQFVDQVAA